MQTPLAVLITMLVIGNVSAAWGNGSMLTFPMHPQSYDEHCKPPWERGRQVAENITRDADRRLVVASEAWQAAYAEASRLREYNQKQLYACADRVRAHQAHIENERRKAAAEQARIEETRRRQAQETRQLQQETWQKQQEASRTIVPVVPSEKVRGSLAVPDNKYPLFPTIEIPSPMDGAPSVSTMNPFSTMTDIELQKRYRRVMADAKLAEFLIEMGLEKFPIAEKLWMLSKRAYHQSVIEDKLASFKDLSPQERSAMRERLEREANCDAVGDAVPAGGDWISEQCRTLLGRVDRWELEPSSRSQPSYIPKIPGSLDVDPLPPNLARAVAGITAIGAEEVGWEDLGSGDWGNVRVTRNYSRGTSVCREYVGSRHGSDGRTKGRISGSLCRDVDGTWR